jgi:hypothetical protein
MTATYRTVTGTVLKPDGTAYTDTAVSFVLQSEIVSGGTVVLPYQIDVITNNAGYFSVSLAVPTTGTAFYRIGTADGGTQFVNLAAGAATSLDVIMTIPAASAAQDPLQTLVDAMAVRETFGADVISEFFTGSGVTIDGVLLKDGGVTTDTIAEKTSGAGVTADGVLLKDSTVGVDTITEKTAGAGITADGVLLKDGGVRITGFDFAPLPVAGHPTIRAVATNAGTRLYVTPNGSPGAGLQAGFKMFNSDFWADQVNYADFGLWAGDDYNYINSKQNGTGVRKDIVFSLNDTILVGLFKMSDGSGWLGLGRGNTAPTCQLDVEQYTATTNSVVQVLRLAVNSTGTPAAGFGTGIAMYADSDGSEDRYQARILSSWVDATDVSRKAALKFYVFDTAQREVLALSGLGAEAGVGFFGVTPAARVAHIADPAGGATTDAEARAAINAILSALETYGLLKTA